MFYRICSRIELFKNLTSCALLQHIVTPLVSHNDIAILYKLLQFAVLLCFVSLRYACYVTLCYVKLCCVVLCYVMLCHLIFYVTVSLEQLICMEGT